MVLGFRAKNAVETNRRYTTIYSAPDWSIFLASFCAGVREAFEHEMSVYLPHCDSLSAPKNMLGRVQYLFYIAYPKY